MDQSKSRDAFKLVNVELKNYMKIMLIKRPLTDEIKCKTKLKAFEMDLISIFLHTRAFMNTKYIWLNVKII